MPFLVSARNADGIILHVQGGHLGLGAYKEWASQHFALPIVEIAAGELPTLPPKFAPGNYTATIKDGVVTGITTKPEPPSLYIHHTITGAFTDGPEGTPSVAAGETIQINLSVQQSPDPASPVVDNFSSWLRVPYRINNNEKRFRRVQFTAGEATISFTPQANHWGNMSVNEADFVEIGGYQIKLAEPISIDIDEL
jgi:hypothetical protein